jgi:hypothetical protein
VLRTPTAAIDRINASLPHHDASKLEFVIHCLNGTYILPSPSPPTSL